MKGMLEPTFEERVIGTAEVRDSFQVPKVGLIAGCSVISGQD
jgi:translation initiation factor IF-2